MEEVIGTIPIRSTKHFKHLAPPPSRDSFASFFADSKTTPRALGIPPGTQSAQMLTFANLSTLGSCLPKPLCEFAFYKAFKTELIRFSSSLAGVALGMHLESRLPLGNCHEFIEANWEDALTNRCSNPAGSDECRTLSSPSCKVRGE
jgi:hypothetical protein